MNKFWQFSLLGCLLLTSCGQTESNVPNSLATGESISVESHSSGVDEDVARRYDMQDAMGELIVEEFGFDDVAVMIDTSSEGEDLISVHLSGESMIDQQGSQISDLIREKFPEHRHSLIVVTNMEGKSYESGPQEAE